MPSPIMPLERTPAHQYMFATPMGQLVPRSLAFEALEDAAEDDNDVASAVAARPAAAPAALDQPSTFMSAAPHTLVAPASTGLPASATLAAPATALAEGDAVRVVGRPERWLTGRFGRMHSLDAETGRYLVMLPSLPGEQPPNHSGREPSRQPREPLAMLLKPRHVVRVDTPETAPETAPEVAPETAPAWQLQIFHGTANLEHIRAAFTPSELEHVQLVSLQVDNLSNLAHNELMCTHWLWERVRPISDRAPISDDLRPPL